MQVPISFNTHERELLLDTMTWLDARWDDKVELFLHQKPDIETGKRHHSIRETAFYALGLLARDAADDRERAIRALNHVLDYQWDAPRQRYHGSFARWPEETAPIDKAADYANYDPNWREFIGLSLEKTLRFYSEKLPPMLIERIEKSLQLAVEGSIQRVVPASYTNIALMAAFLYDACGQRFNRPEWSTGGLKLAEEIYRYFRRNDTFLEFNSPTYYGVDLWALAAWRKLAHAPQMCEWGAEMEQILWADMACYYHADLKNFCGPYARSYSMDMTKFVSLIALWIRLLIGRDNAPVPNFLAGDNHSHDVAGGCLYPLLGLPDLPASVTASFQASTGPHQIESIIELTPLRRATAVVETNWMMGGDSRCPKPTDQFHGGTLHWKPNADAPVHWLKVQSVQALSVVVDKRIMRIGFTDSQPRPITLQLFVPGATAEDIAAGKWPSLAVKIEPKLGVSQVRTGENDHWEVDFPAGEEVHLEVVD